MLADKKKERADRFGSPEGAESSKLDYRDEGGHLVSAAEWLARVIEDAEDKTQRGMAASDLSAPH